MIVVDASAMVEALVGRAPDPRLLDALSGVVEAPQHLDVEVLSVLRGLTLGGKLAAERAEEALGIYLDLDITRRDVAPFARRVWSLRHQYTSYDAAYLALAEGLDAPLYTCDRKLAAGGHEAQVVLL
ncbi:type II toxin-antitoxin system VapC family toxin [Janibacter sp. G349]|uniref:type II toxin-antitoxin system VapC family toxin n=1 Tax=unclassified Janibacter TaxID=2649294 RepID=UPI003B7C1814